MTLTVASAAGLDDTYGFWLSIEPDDVGQREIMRITAVVGNVLTIGARYLAGSAAGSGLVHPTDSVIRMSSFAQAFEDLHDRIDAIAPITDHGALGGKADDDHTQYLNETRHDADDHSSLTPAEIGAAPAAEGVTNGDTHDHAGGDGGQVDHGGLGGLGDDDHSQYLNVARHDADDHSGLIEVIRLGEAGALAASGTGGMRWYAEFDCDIQHVNIALETGTITVDVHRNGTTIFTTQGNRPQIASGNFDKSGTPDGTTAMTAETDYLTIDWESASSAENLAVSIVVLRT
jgi:hypothetical protein